MVGAVGVGVLRIVVIAIAAIDLFRMMWRVAEPNEALIISGLHHKRHPEFGDSLGFKIVTGMGTRSCCRAFKWCASSHWI